MACSRLSRLLAPLFEQRVAHPLDLPGDVLPGRIAVDVVLQLGDGRLGGLELLVVGPHLRGIFGGALAEERGLQGFGRRRIGVAARREAQGLVVLFGGEAATSAFSPGELLAQLGHVGLGEGRVERRQELPLGHRLALAHVHGFDDRRVEHLEGAERLDRHDLAAGTRHHAIDGDEGRDADERHDHERQQPDGGPRPAGRGRLGDGVDLRLPLPDDLEGLRGTPRREGLRHQWGPL